MDCELTWELPPATLECPRETIHLWRVSLDQPAGVYAVLRTLLSSQERRRADRFVFERDRQRFVVARGLLRALLGRYLATDPVTIRFCYGAYGKPALDDGQNNPDLHFNLSHSQGLALIGVTRGQPIGVDLEFTRRKIDYAEIVRRHFPAYERRVVLEGAPADQRASFFEHWVSREAYLKATGRGFAGGLDAFDVVLESDSNRGWVNFRDEQGLEHSWPVYRCTPADGFVGAVAVLRTVPVLKAWQVHDEALLAGLRDASRSR